MKDNRGESSGGRIIQKEREQAREEEPDKVRRKRTKKQRKRKRKTKKTKTERRTSEYIKQKMFWKEIAYISDLGGTFKTTNKITNIYIPSNRTTFKPNIQPSDNRKLKQDSSTRIMHKKHQEHNNNKSQCKHIRHTRCTDTT